MERVPTFVFMMGLLFFLGFTQLYAEPMIDRAQSDSVRYLIASLGGEIGIKSIGLSGVMIQLLLRYMQSKSAENFFYKQKPWVRLSIVSALTFSITPLGLMAIPGMAISSALMHTATLNAFMVFIDQILKHLPGKKDEPNEPRK